MMHTNIISRTGIFEYLYVDVAPRWAHDPGTTTARYTHALPEHSRKYDTYFSLSVSNYCGTGKLPLNLELLICRHKKARRN